MMQLDIKARGASGISESIGGRRLSSQPRPLHYPVAMTYLQRAVALYKYSDKKVLGLLKKMEEMGVEAKFFSDPVLRHEAKKELRR